MANTAKQLAARFSQQLREDLTPTEMDTVIAQNRRYAQQGETSVCASHEVCDSNMTMLAAFQALFDRDPDVRCADDANLINEAWDIAKANEFDPKPID
jgi:hypothetical protein